MIYILIGMLLMGLYSATCTYKGQIVNPFLMVATLIAWPIYIIYLLWVVLRVWTQRKL